jgi:hypothetical protein
MWFWVQWFRGCLCIDTGELSTVISYSPIVVFSILRFQFV